jgi:probable rRNA maturation factor
MINLSVSTTNDTYRYNYDSIKKLCSLVLDSPNYESITINMIFTNDEDLSEMKREYFNEDVLTDVLVFPMQNDILLDSEFYISYERAMESSKEFGVSLNNELVRLIVHGLLHLLGYKDDNDKSKKIMFNKQEAIVESCNINII